MQAEQAEFLTTREAAKLIRSTPGALGKGRCIRSRIAPPYIKLGRKVLYNRRELLEWLAEHRVDPSKWLTPPPAPDR
jgi:hypothetical protein